MNECGHGVAKHLISSQHISRFHSVSLAKPHPTWSDLKNLFTSSRQLVSIGAGGWLSTLPVDFTHWAESFLCRHHTDIHSYGSEFTPPPQYTHTPSFSMTRSCLTVSNHSSHQKNLVEEKV